MIFDIGPKSAQELADIIGKAGTIVWNGPVGVFEFDQFGEGTKTVSMAIASADGFSLAGGGRHDRRHSEIRYLRQDFLYLHGRRGVSGVPGGQDAAGGGHAGSAGRALSQSFPTQESGLTYAKAHENRRHAGSGDG